MSRNLLPWRLVCNSEMPGLGKTSVVFLHCLLSVYDDGNCAVHRRRYGVCVCVCVSREMPCCCCFLAPGNWSRRTNTWRTTIFTVARIVYRASAAFLSCHASFATSAGLLRFDYAIRGTVICVGKPALNIGAGQTERQILEHQNTVCFKNVFFCLMAYLFPLFFYLVFCVYTLRCPRSRVCFRREVNWRKYLWP